MAKQTDDEKVKPMTGTAATMKVGLKNMAAFINTVKEGEQINVWGNLFTVGENGKLEAEIDTKLAKDGIVAGRYIEL